MVFGKNIEYQKKEFFSLNDGLSRQKINDEIKVTDPFGEFFDENDSEWGLVSFVPSENVPLGPRLADICIFVNPVPADIE